MPNERARVNVPDHRNLVAFEIFVCSFARAPVRRNRRKVPHDQPFDIRPRRLLIIEVRANIPNVGIGQADNLSRVAGVGENFLISGKTGVKNNFAATAAMSARRTSFKYSSVFEREYRASLVRLLQRVLRCVSS